jgi:hypothetical protein
LPLKTIEAGLFLCDRRSEQGSAPNAALTDRWPRCHGIAVNGQTALKAAFFLPEMLLLSASARPLRRLMPI